MDNLFNDGSATRPGQAYSIQMQEYSAQMLNFAAQVQGNLASAGYFGPGGTR
jgi:hypothetical protein